MHCKLNLQDPKGRFCCNLPDLSSRRCGTFHNIVSTTVALILQSAEYQCRFWSKCHLPSTTISPRSHQHMEHQAFLPELEACSVLSAPASFQPLRVPIQKPNAFSTAFAPLLAVNSAKSFLPSLFCAFAEARNSNHVFIRFATASCKTSNMLNLLRFRLRLSPFGCFVLASSSTDCPCTF